MIWKNKYYYLREDYSVSIGFVQPLKEKLRNIHKM